MSHDANNLRRDATELARNTGGGWVRTAGNNAAPNPQQMALVIGVAAAGGTSPHYTTPYDLTFTDPHDIDGSQLIVDVVLLKNYADTSGALAVDNDDGLTLEQLTIAAVDVRREGRPLIGDLVYIWASDGQAVQPGEDGWDSGIFTGQHGIYTAPVNATDYLRGLDTWNDTDDLLLASDPSDHTIKWVTPADYPGGPIGSGGGGGGITGVAEGYAIDVTGTGSVTVHNNPTEWTSFDNTTGHYQFFSHTGTGSTPNRTDPAWQTVSGYDATVNQIWFVKAGTVTAQTTSGYSTAANTQQFINNKSGVWEWDDSGSVRCTTADSTLNMFHDAFADKTAAGTYVSGQDAIIKNETVGAANTDQTERTFFDVSVVTGWSSGTAQILTHDSSGNLKWGNSNSSVGLRFGKITTAASAITTFGTPTVDGRMTLEDGTTGVIVKNHYPDKAPVNVVACIDSDNALVDWSCATI